MYVYLRTLGSEGFVHGLVSLLHPAYQPRSLVPSLSNKKAIVFGI